jgi:DNA-binding transcriptional MerR regulator
MKIKDAEKITGVPSANIRYYEQEGLIHPQRNQENNYREYTSSDIECLQKIKFLRLLGVSLPDIRLLTTGKLSLDTVMKHRLEQIDTEEMNLSEMRTVCEYILRNHLDLSMINEELFEASGISWQARLEDIFRSDPVKDFLSKKELNRTVGCMLAWGFFVNLLVTLLCGNYLLHHTDSRICFYITAICVMMSAINSILIH